MQRHQFPVSTAFAMTIQKTQGQTFLLVGLFLPTAVFMHGMLYVAFFRAKRQNGLKVLLPPENAWHTRNVVWRVVLQDVSIANMENVEDMESWNFLDNFEGFNISMYKMYQFHRFWYIYFFNFYVKLACWISSL